MVKLSYTKGNYKEVMSEGYKASHINDLFLEVQSTHKLFFRILNFSLLSILLDWAINFFFFFSSISLSLLLINTKIPFQVLKVTRNPFEVTQLLNHT